MMEVVCAVIGDAAGRVLAAQRPPAKAQAGYWKFPGGKIKPGEAADSALVREIRGEIGCTLAVGAALTPVDHPYPGGVIRPRAFMAEIVDSAPEPHEHSALRWVGRDEAATLHWAPADVPILAEI